MELNLKGRRAAVTGASRGLGRAIALALAAEGAQVMAIARHPDRLAKLVACGSGHIESQVCDLSRADELAVLAPRLAAVDILVLNSGGPPPGPVADVADEVWTNQFNAMFLSFVRLTRAALPGMRERGFGRILALVSSGVVQPLPNLGISNALRLAVVGWAKTLANEVARDGITVNCVAPGRIETDRVAELDRARAQREGLEVGEVERQSRLGIPLGRYGQPQELAALAAFLLSERAGYVTGSILRVDGGMIRSL
jgi:3-oxoacyl-[acyl-carrier protein] reductase